MSNQKRRQSPQAKRGEQAAARARLIAAKLTVRASSRATILDAMRRDPWEVHRQVFLAVSGNAAITANLFGTPFPAEFRSFSQGDAPPSGSRPVMALDHELLWSLSVLRWHVTELEPMLTWATNIDLHILADDFAKASSSLAAFHKRYGVSLWYIAKTLTLSARTQSIAATRQLTQAMIDSASSSYVAAFTLMASLRADRSVTLDVMESELERYFAIGRLEANSPRIAYHLRFMGAFDTLRHFPDELLAHNIAYGERYALIDRYYALLNTMQVLAARAQGSEPDWIRGIAHRARSIIADPGFTRLVEILTGTLEPDASDAALKIAALVEMYTIGHYGDVAKQSLLALRQAPNIFEYYELYVTAIARMDEYSNDDDFDSTPLIGDMLKLERRDTDARRSIVALRKAVMERSGTRFGASLSAFVAARSPELCSVIPLRWQALHATAATPRDALAVHPELAVPYLADLASRPFPTAVLLFQADLGLRSSDDIETLPIERKLKHQGQAAERTGQFGVAISCYRALQTAAGNRAAIARPALEAEYRCHRALGQWSHCLNIVAIQLIEGESVYFPSQASSLVESVLSSGDASLQTLLPWPIVNFRQLRTAPTGRDGHVAFAALEAVLNAHNLSRPHEFREIQHKFSLTQLIYVLRYVCIPDLLDWSLEYESQDDLDQERIAILDLLEELDPPGAEIYREERTQVTRRAVVQLGLREVDRGKIHVDTAGIRQTLGETFLQRVDRYVQLRSLPDKINEVFPAFGVNSKGVFIVTATADGGLVADDGSRMFASLHRELRNRFVSSDEHGLDTALSLEIRHGTLEGQIRGAFERAHLITRRGVPGSPYAPNQRWQEAARDEPEDARMRVDEVLSAFSQQIDGVIERVRDNWLQVRDADTKREALFDFEFSNEAIIAARDRADAAVDRETFLDAVFDDLWQRTRENLVRVQQAIRNKLGTELNQQLTSLEANVIDIVPTIAEELRQHIAMCRGELEDELAGIEAWFAVDESSAMSDYELSVLIDTAVAQVSRASGTADFAPVSEIVGSIQLQGRTFRPLATLVTIMLENVVRHAPGCAASVQAHTTGNRLQLIVANDLPSGVSMESLTDMVPVLEANARGQGTRGVVRREGGSGYSKMGKLLKYDLKRHVYDVNVAVTGDRKFAVTIAMELDELVV